MQTYEYKVVPAPKKALRRGAKTAEARFGLALAETMNEMAAEGWEYLRAEALPCDRRVGLTGSETTYHNMLVFRRRAETVDTFFGTPEVQDPPRIALVEAPAPKAPETITVTAEEVPDLDPVGDKGALDILRNRKARQDREAVELAVVKDAKDQAKKG